ncbi:MAG: thiolase domain-containing protein [Candidatus Micrarchaeota archaeon]
MRDVAIVGAGMVRFGKHNDTSFVDLAAKSSLRALEDARMSERDVDALYMASLFAGELNHQVATASALADSLALLPAAANRVENGPASGGSAIREAYMAVASGVHDTVLVTGCDKMRHVSGALITDYVATMAHPIAEYPHGVTLPSLAAMLARLYMHKYGMERKHLAMVAVKNQKNGVQNPYAHIQQEVTMDGILYAPEAEMNNPLVSDPLRLYDCCPISDGSASVVICAAEKAKEFTDTPVILAGIGQGTDTLAVHEREDPTILNSVRVASKQAFERAKLTPKDISFAELHDAFSILEIVESEDAGFFEKGKGFKALEEGITQKDGKFPINPSGGLKARGHPVGATGVAQAAEITWQLQGEAGGKQINGAETAYCCNFGGFGNNVTALVMKRKN